MSNCEARGGIGDAELYVDVVAHKAATKREDAGEDGEVVGGKPEADESVNIFLPSAPNQV